MNADGISYLGVDGTILSYNLYTYCGNNPVLGYDPEGTFNWSNFGKGAGWLVVGITAVCVGVSVLTCGVATPLMLAVAGVTVAAGVATTVNGVSEIGEAATGHNFMRDDVFQGNTTAYNAYANTTAGVAQIGTAICGGWLNSSKVQTQIADNKLQKIINNPQSISKYSVDKFNNVAKKSSWNYLPTKNGKGFRVLQGDKAIRYNMNGTRFDAAHFGGKPYWVVSSAKYKPVKIPMMKV